LQLAHTSVAKVLYFHANRIFSEDFIVVWYLLYFFITNGHAICSSSMTCFFCNELFQYCKHPITFGLMPNNGKKHIQSLHSLLRG
jgi:hypothetical protein